MLAFPPQLRGVRCLSAVGWTKGKLPWRQVLSKATFNLHNFAVRQVQLLPFVHEYVARETQTGVVGEAAQCPLILCNP